MKKLVFDTLSDIHLPSYLKISAISGSYSKLIKSLYPKGHRAAKTFVLAGDLSEDIDQVIVFLKSLKTEKKYTTIIYVPGNHELYLTSLKWRSSKEKYNEIIRRVNELNPIGIYALDGTSIMVEGFKIGGATGWYDGKYHLHCNPQIESDAAFRREVRASYKRIMLDSKYVPEDLFDMYEWQKEKLLNIGIDVDIVISHVSPLLDSKYLNEKWRDKEGSAFFSSNSGHIVRLLDPLLWIFGHAHDHLDEMYGDTRMLCNPYGYPYEKEGNKTLVQKITVEKR